MRADPIPGTIEERRCADCGAPLVRKVRPSGRPETAGKFRSRRYCDVVCYRHAALIPRNAQRRADRLERKIERAWARQEAAASRLLSRPQQMAALEAELRATDLWRDLPAPQYGTLRLLAALCWKYRGLAAAREFIDSVASTVRAASSGTLTSMVAS